MLRADNAQQANPLREGGGRSKWGRKAKDGAQALQGPAQFDPQQAIWGMRDEDTVFLQVSIGQGYDQRTGAPSTWRINAFVLTEVEDGAGRWKVMACAHTYCRVKPGSAGLSPADLEMVPLIELEGHAYIVSYLGHDDDVDGKLSHRLHERLFAMLMKRVDETPGILNEMRQFRPRGWSCQRWGGHAKQMKNLVGSYGDKTQHNAPQLVRVRVQVPALESRLEKLSIKAPGLGGARHTTGGGAVDNLSDLAWLPLRQVNSIGRPVCGLCYECQQTGFPCLVDEGWDEAPECNTGVAAAWKNHRAMPGPAARSALLPSRMSSG